MPEMAEMKLRQACNLSMLLLCVVRLRERPDDSVHAIGVQLLWLLRGRRHCQVWRR